MKQNRKQISAILLLILAIIIGFITYTIHSIKQSSDSEKNENKPRTTYTTQKLPDEKYRNSEMLHTMFENMSGLQLDEAIQDKKITIYTYKFTVEDANQEGDIFADFGKRLLENGYEQIAESATSDGYKNQYELYYKNTHYVIYTESSPDNTKLSILNYNDK